MNLTVTDSLVFQRILKQIQKQANRVLLQEDIVKVHHKNEIVMTGK